MTFIGAGSKRPVDTGVSVGARQSRARSSLLLRMAGIEIGSNGKLTPAQIRECALIEQELAEAAASFGISLHELEEFLDAYNARESA
jgi:hypothetical protein